MKKWTNLAILLKTYLLALAIFFVFRLILFFAQLGRIENFGNDFGNILLAFLMGIRFDIVISGYILILPFFVLSLLFIFKRHPKWIYTVLFYWTFILFTLAFAVCAADIPYFSQFFSRFSVMAFQWLDNPSFIFKMIFQEPRYFIILIPLIFFIIIFYKILKRIFFTDKERISGIHYSLKIVVSVLFMGLIILGIRGRLEAKAPIKVGTAYFSDNAFLNQLGLNPVFTLIRSWIDNLNENNSFVNFMDDETAISKVRDYLGIANPEGDYPIARQVLSGGREANNYNVILVIMESMSAAKMTRHGHKNNLTPFLDSLATRSYYFENVYTAGIHTFNGIFSTLFSFPAIYRQNPMKESTIYRYNGIGYTLKKNGYATAYFTTHDGQFDNVEGFLRANDFEHIITVEDYPSDAIKTTLGVPDDYMFEFAMPVLDDLYRQEKPFFAAFMTASDHGPYYLPAYFIPRNRHIKDQMVEYADWSLRKLVTMASEKEWYENTLFVFVADHGSSINAVYDIPLDYHHTPLIFYGPEILGEPETFSNIGGQIDVFPTIMGILNQPYVNNTLGLDLLKEKRPYIFINHEDKFGVLDREYLLILKKEGGKALYKYRENDKKDYQIEYAAKAREMEDYIYSNLQVFQFLMRSEKRFYE